MRRRYLLSPAYCSIIDYAIADILKLGGRLKNSSLTVLITDGYVSGVRYEGIPDAL